MRAGQAFVLKLGLVYDDNMFFWKTNFESQTLQTYIIVLNTLLGSPDLNE